MTFTIEWTATIPAEKTQYRSSLFNNKLIELKSAGDLISNNTTILSETQKKITMIWKNEAAYNLFKEWLKESGEGANIMNWRTVNGIEVVGI